MALSEIILILILMVIFVKPEELPGVFEKVGHMYRQLKKTYSIVEDWISGQG